MHCSGWRDVLSHLHTGFKFGINQCLIAYGELGEVDRNHLVAASHGNQVAVEHVGIERCDGRHQLGHRLEASIEGLISRELIFSHTTTPEAFAVEAHIPVRQVVVDEIGYQSASLGRLVVVVAGIHILHQRIEQGQNPAVYLGTFLHGHVGFLVFEAVNVGIEGEEGIRII